MIALMGPIVSKIMGIYRNNPGDHKESSPESSCKRMQSSLGLSFQRQSGTFHGAATHKKWN